ncbi:molybdate ABC transporter substrate-binding protein [Corynebacterium tuberculostearicum]|uniref:molybdate ABC transporter substrate-binding protein n=1 Tax=Corynebacterium tuberculostearicum TaxID=38304 RepID=UPI00264F7C41|nr:molybdate ABC transporter substrate-binding protein [Corynebacterium tuberculostearicum]MDN8596344.1 molybdate ABC transporter substrate-binding protein [Corynebacterium tuberculostearicum]
MKKRAAALLAALAFALAACAPPTSTTSAQDADAATLNVLAASSTRVINDELTSRAGQLAPPVNLNFENGGSSDLVSKLREGAPADLLLTASKKTMDKAVQDGTVATPEVLATNVMVMVVPKGNPAGIHSVEDLPHSHHFVLCDPQVPCGDISSQIISDKRLDVHPSSQERQVADVLGKVASGEADAGWVYSTDAAAAGDDVEVIDIPGAEKFTNQIVGAVTAEASHPDQARAVLDILSGDFASTWRERGFTPAE